MILEIKNASCGYNKKPIVRDISFIVKSGEICCILGPNGVGKTTIFKTVLGFLKPISGKILVNGVDVQNWKSAKLARVLGYVPQAHVPPFSYKVIDVVLLGRTSYVGYFGKPSIMDYKAAENALEDMGITYLRDNIYTEISGGERQMVLIARALAQQPEFLVMDEPTANLDFGNQVRVLKQVKKLAQNGLGVIMTTHVPDQTFQFQCNVALLQKNGSFSFGDSNKVVTEKNLKAAYGVDVKIAELMEVNGNRIKVCAPVLD